MPCCPHVEICHDTVGHGVSAANAGAARSKVSTTASVDKASVVISARNKAVGDGVGTDAVISSGSGFVG